MLWTRDSNGEANLIHMEVSRYALSNRMVLNRKRSRGP